MEKIWLLRRLLKSYSMDQKTLEYEPSCNVLLVVISLIIYISCAESGLCEHPQAVLTDSVKAFRQ